MTLPHGVRKIIEQLGSAGHHAYVVGGSVRDALRGIPPHDYDMTTDATPEEMKQIFRDHRVIETGIQHGTLTILAEGIPYEVTTYRVDGDYEDHRHPDAVTFTRSLTEDLARRDFTMNAIAYHPDEGYIDPFHGYADIKAGIVRAVGEPHRRFEEDALRILRALRFASVLDYTIDPATAAAAFDARLLLTHVSAERVREELCKLLVGIAAPRILSEHHAILAVRLPQLAPPDDTTLRALAALPEDPVLRLVCLLLPTLAEDGDGMDARMRELRFDNASRRRAAHLAAAIHVPLCPMRAVCLHLLARLGPALADDLCVLRATLAATDAERLSIAETRALVAALVRDDAPYRISDLAVTGDDLTAATTLRGAAIGSALAALLAAVINGRVENTREALLHYIITKI